jgi:hypothetical protein
MLHCNMSASSIQLRVDDMLADLRHARRTDDLGRLALIAYCEVRRWARSIGERELAEQASRMVIDTPHVSREAFLCRIDRLVDELERVRAGLAHEEAERSRAG